MIAVRRSDARGHTALPWLDSRHTFSFGDYHDPEHMGFRTLRVLNEDRVQPERGFSPHSHRDAEILSYVVAGALEHRDSLGNGSVIRPGDVQRMSAGAGVTHSEFNPSAAEPVHFLQIWILPDRRGMPPSYEQRRVDLAAQPGVLRLVASGQPAGDAVRIHQDVAIYGAVLRPGDAPSHPLRPERAAWLHVVRGTIVVGEHELGTGDAAAIDSLPLVALRATSPAEILLFDLA